MPRSMFPEISTDETERSKNGMGCKKTEKEHTKNYGQQVMPVRTPEGFVRNSAWQVADVRRPISHLSKSATTCSSGRMRHSS